MGFGAAIDHGPTYNYNYCPWIDRAVHTSLVLHKMPLSLSETSGPFFTALLRRSVEDVRLVRVVQIETGSITLIDVESGLTFLE